MIPTSGLPLVGVHHTARPTWKLAETVHFYRDLLGLPLVHAISARGWGPEDHADFLHFFFDSGTGSTIAFFYYIGTEAPEFATARDDYRYRATHTAWRVETREDLLACRAKIEGAGLKVNYQIRHEVIESIYFNDPNGYSLEITWQVRPFTELDVADANRTLEAGIALENASREGTTVFSSIDDVWRGKGERLAADMEVQ
ncbi:VOC family protein [Variovorax sp. dw_954]|uniref:VOC family protein n=1 Tax=unclassified Variovorax TaxID=663243 RepID=UPI0031F7172C